MIDEASQVIEFVWIWNRLKGAKPNKTTYHVSDRLSLKFNYIWIILYKAITLKIDSLLYCSFLIYVILSSIKKLFIKL